MTAKETPQNRPLKVFKCVYELYLSGTIVNQAKILIWLKRFFLAVRVSGFYWEPNLHRRNLIAFYPLHFPSTDFFVLFSGALIRYINIIDPVYVCQNEISQA